MDDKDKLIETLQNKIYTLESEVVYLKSILKEKKIEFEEYVDSVRVNDKTELNIKVEVITKEHAKFFYSMFKGRQDVYSKRGSKPNPKTGKTGYYTQCSNFWKDNICHRRYGSKITCKNCEHQIYRHLLGGDVVNHLVGAKVDCSDVIGLYPMFEDETCNFLIFDFDNHDDKSKLDDLANVDNEWIDEVNAMKKICANNGVPVLLERSRSGKGAHIWLFFDEPISAKEARKFGTALLTKGAETVNLKNFKSYDRMLPAQDNLSQNGLGNLIALPLQGQALKQGNSAFIDENWNVYYDQWKVLCETKKLSKVFIEEKISEWSVEGVFGSLVEDMSGLSILENNNLKPWEKRRVGFASSDVEGVLNITIADKIYINTENLRPRIQNAIRRLAAFINPNFYKNQAMGLSNRGISRVISCGQDIDSFICLPRGCEEHLISKLADSEINYSIEDCRQEGINISVNFKGELYPEQQKAVDKMVHFNIGVLSAATAFGKTVVGANIAAQHKVNTLILVHNTEIMKNWVEDLSKFLDINEDLPTYTTPTGRVKSRKSVIGRLYGGHNSVTGIIDVVMISSLGKLGEINQLVKDYGLVIMDECHHGASITSEAVLSEVNAKYVYGFTATPKRDDGMEKKIFMQFGPIRYRYTAKEKALSQGFQHVIYPRFTRLIQPSNESKSINEIYKLVRDSDTRNNQIVADVKECIECGRTPLVLTKFKDHAANLFDNLKGIADNIFLLEGGKSSKEKDKIRRSMKSVPLDETVILVAIGQYIGEGFNFPRLDTLMLTTPIAWQGNVEQYAGRLHRSFDGKQDVIIYDYVDTHIRVLEKMYQKRLKAYKQIGYKICTSFTKEKQEINSIYDSDTYREVYERDIVEANSEIIISSPGLNENKVKSLLKVLNDSVDKNLSVIVYTLKAECYPEDRVSKTKQLIKQLRDVGIEVYENSEIYEHYAIFDKEIVWYGSVNLLSREKNDDNIIRLVSKEIAQELMEIST